MSTASTTIIDRIRRSGTFWTFSCRRLDSSSSSRGSRGAKVSFAVRGSHSFCVTITRFCRRRDQGSNHSLDLYSIQFRSQFIWSVPPPTSQGSTWSTYKNHNNSASLSSNSNMHTAHGPGTLTVSSSPFTVRELGERSVDNNGLEQMYKLSFDSAVSEENVWRWDEVPQRYPCRSEH